MKRACAALILVAAIASAEVLDGGPRRARGLVDWICSLFGASCDGGLDAVRSNAREWGAEVRTFDPRTRREKTLFPCGQCRSPLALGKGEIAVATPNGVLVVKGTARRTYELAGAVQLLGVVPDAGLAALRSAPRDGGAEMFELVMLNLRDGGLEVLDQLPPVELAVRPSQVSDAGTVMSKPGSVDVTLSQQGGAPFRLIKPGDRLPDVARFDPSWSPDGVVYSVQVTR